MKDYTLDYDDSDKYILSCDIKKELIVEKLASGKLHTIPYSRENYNKIIFEMKEQARRAQIIPLITNKKLFPIWTPLITLLISNFYFLNIGGWLLATVRTLNAVLAIYISRNIMLKIVKNEDIKKKKYFLRYNDELNEIIRNRKSKELDLSKKAIEQINLRISVGIPPLDINDLVYYSLKDLKKLRNDTKEISSFEFNEVDYTFVPVKPIIIKDLTQYRQELEKGSSYFDFSHLKVSGEDIQSISLENLNLDINLRKVFVPYDGVIKWGNNHLTPIISLSKCGGDDFLNLKYSKLGGNNVTGDLTPFKRNSYDKPVYFCYSEETFDDNYKSKYPQFFISKDAPSVLREKYYNPKNICVKFIDPCEPVRNSKYNYVEREANARQTLTFDEYLEYYKFLKGKYLGNFSISKQDLKKIEIIEMYGLEKGKEILEKKGAVLDRVNNINQTGNYEACDTIDKIVQKDGSFALSLKLRR